MSGGSRTTRVASWNIRATIGPREPFPPPWWRHVDRGRLERIARIITALGAELIALQEVAVLTPHGELDDQPAELANLTGMEMRYAAVHAFAMIEPADGRAIGAATWGNAVLARRPLSDAFAVGLPVGRDEDLVEPAGSGLPLAGVTFFEAPFGTREPRCAVGGRLAGREAGGPRRASCGPDRIDHLLTRGLRPLDCGVYRKAGDASDHFPVVATFEAVPRA